METFVIFSGLALRGHRGSARFGASGVSNKCVAHDQIHPFGLGMPAMRAAILAGAVRKQLVELFHADA